MNLSGIRPPLVSPGQKSCTSTLVSTRFSEPSLLTSVLTATAAAAHDDVTVFIHVQILLSRPHLGIDKFESLGDETLNRLIYPTIS